MRIKCKYCESENTRTFLRLKDYFLTHEEFEIIECQNCNLLFTSPEPPQSEIGRYYKSEDYLSHNEHKKGLIPLIYNSIKKINIKNKFNIAISGATGNRLLDYGCGVGDFLLHAQQNGFIISGCDLSENARKQASEKLNTKIMSPEEASALPHSTFDIITMWHVLEHVSDLKSATNTLHNLLAPKGRLVIAVPNYKSFDARHYKDKWAAYDVPRHLYHFHKESLEFILQNKFKLKSITPLKWDAFYISIMSERYKKSKLSFIKGVLKGMKSNKAGKKSGEYSSLIYVFDKI
ncbi:MAG: class I SAM-dependent methyltransferase [Candidatus Limimorpha sp.]